MILDEKRQTIETYNKSVVDHAKKFDEMGARTEDILKTFSYIKKPNPKTIELGCGNGRDAKEIIKHTNDYLGLDLSEEMLRLAQRNVPNTNFILADLESYVLPEELDVIFAFASLLHSDKKSVSEVLKRSCKALNIGGVFFISSKYGHYHKETIDKEGHGPKTYYFYTPEEIERIAPEGLRVVFNETQDFKGQKWFTVIFQKT
ncbi:MAG: class I SAM-dependent methyltransferase [Patescibacteria group bacterium]